MTDHKTNKTKQANKGWGGSSVVESLLGICEALNSNPSIHPKREKNTIVDSRNNHSPFTFPFSFLSKTQNNINAIIWENQMFIERVNFVVVSYFLLWTFSH